MAGCLSVAWHLSVAPSIQISDSLAVPHAKMHAHNLYSACAVNFVKYIYPANNVLVAWGLGFQKWRTLAAVSGRPNHDTRPFSVITL